MPPNLSRTEKPCATIVCLALTQSDSTNWYGASKNSLKSRGAKEWAPEGPFPARSRRRSVRLYATERNPGSVGGNLRYVAAGNLWNYHEVHAAYRGVHRRDRPTVDEAKEAAAREQTVLVDGFLAPTWSWRDTPELWSGKHKTTGFNGQAIANLPRGDLLFVSEPVTGHNHDMTALAETETADIIAAAYSGIGDKGYQGSDFITPFKKPKGGELLDWQKEFNAQVNKLRAPVERAIAISNPGVFFIPITGGRSAHTSRPIGRP